MQDVLTDALALRDRRDAHTIADQGLAVARECLLARLGRLIDTAPALPAATRFAKHLAVEFPAVLVFLWDPSIDATNRRAEDAIRPAVVNRKICGAIGRRTGRTLNRSSPASSTPLVSATSISHGFVAEVRGAFVGTRG